MSTKKKKSPVDYPQFYCRMAEEDKDEIEKLIEKIVKLETTKRTEGDYKPRRNEFIAKGLKRGLKSILRELS